jgi:outer membrane protein assembly factor BamB
VEAAELTRQWPSGGPKILWTTKLLGPGHAGAAVAAGRVFVLDHDVDLQADALRCLSLDDGREIWRNGYPVAISENHGMSRTVPAVFEDCVVTLGPKCQLASWDVKTGKCLWLLDLVLKYHTKVPPWYAGQCPLVDQGRLIVAPAGDACLAALDCRSGKVLWETPKVRDWDMTHVSIAPMEFHGRRMYVYCGSQGVVGISARDGAVLWESTAWVGNMATCPTPVPIPGDRVFFCSGYNAGSMMLQLAEESGRIVAKPLWRLKAKQFESEQHTPLSFDGHLYGVRTKAGGEQLVCLDLNGKEAWNSGSRKFGRGPYMIANGLLYALADNGLLTMAEATHESFRPLGQFQVFDQAVDAWAPMAFASGRLLLRDLTRLSCISLTPTAK